MADRFEQCDARRASAVFSRFAFGDPLPHNARYVGEDGDVKRSEAVTVYVRCEREAGHAGKHLAYGTPGWIDE